MYASGPQSVRICVLGCVFTLLCQQEMADIESIHACVLNLKYFNHMSLRRSCFGRFPLLWEEGTIFARLRRTETKTRNTEHSKALSNICYLYRTEV